MDCNHELTRYWWITPESQKVALSDLIWYTLSLCIDIQVKELDKRASGQAFEVILSPTAPDTKGEFPLSTPKKKDVSLEEIQRKLDAAEERRKVAQHI